MPDETSINFPVRVRRSLDERVTDLVYALRKQGVRTTKQEIAEMLLWELPERPDDAFVQRLDEFQCNAGRHVSALNQRAVSG
jgi:hypothetical protein